MSAKPAGKGGYPNRNGFDSRQPKLISGMRHLEEDKYAFGSAAARNSGKAVVPVTAPDIAYSVPPEMVSRIKHRLHNVLKHGSAAGIHIWDDLVKKFVISGFFKIAAYAGK